MTKIAVYSVGMMETGLTKGMMLTRRLASIPLNKQQFKLLKKISKTLVVVS